MAQGSGKLAKKSKSKGAQKRQAVRQKTLSKGRKTFRNKAQSTNIHVQANEETTREINRRNETIVAAKAVGSGINFFLKDVAEKGGKEAKKQIQARDKKEQKQKSSKLTDRLVEQLSKVK